MNLGCINLIKSVCEKSATCYWKVSEDETCGWCQVQEDTVPKTKPDYCDECAIHESSELCKESKGCEWCNLNYCSKSKNCTIRCELITTEKDCGEASDDCSWCPTALSCIDIKARCNECSDFSNDFCPRGCDCSSSKSSAAIVVIVVVVCVVLVAALLMFLFVFKKRFGYQKNGTNEITPLSDMSMTLMSTFGFNDKERSHELCANYENGDISEFISCSDDYITFDQSNSFLLLNKTYSSQFKLTNKSDENLTVELFTCGFQEKHKINFVPQKGNYISFVDKLNYSSFAWLLIVMNLSIIIGLV